MGVCQNYMYLFLIQIQKLETLWVESSKVPYLVLFCSYYTYMINKISDKLYTILFVDTNVSWWIWFKSVGWWIKKWITEAIYLAHLK